MTSGAIPLVHALSKELVKRAAELEDWEQALTAFTLIEQLQIDLSELPTLCMGGRFSGSSYEHAHDRSIDTLGPVIRARDAAVVSLQRTADALNLAIKAL